MNARELTAYLVTNGRLPSVLQDEAAKRIEEGMKRKGSKAIEDKFLNRYKPIPSLRIVELMIPDLADAPSPQTVALSEAEQEEEDYKANVWFNKQHDRKFVKPDHFKGKPLPVYLFSKPIGMTSVEFREKVQKYVENPYATVRKKAKAEGITMHEWCRRNGLKYEALLI